MQPVAPADPLGLADGQRYRLRPGHPPLIMDGRVLPPCTVLVADGARQGRAFQLRAQIVAVPDPHEQRRVAPGETVLVSSPMLAECFEWLADEPANIG